MGNLETVLTEAQVLKDAHYRAEVARLSAMIVQSIETSGWQTGVPLSVEMPGLMTGIAGIGYKLLRLARPARLPNLLILEGPPACRRPPSSLLEPDVPLFRTTGRGQEFVLDCEEYPQALA